MNAKVLVVDDSIDMHELVAIHLRQDAIETVRAFTAEQAMSLARSVSPAAILLDLELGKVNGLDVCRALKADPETRATPIIILTGTIDSPIKLKAFTLGAVDYVIKPFSGSDLRTRVRTAVRLKRYRELLAEHAELDAETELRTRRAFDRRAAALAPGEQSLVLTLGDDLAERFGVPFLEAGIRALAQVVRAVPEVDGYRHDERAIAVITSNAEALARLRERAAALSLTQGGQAIPLDIACGGEGRGDDRRGA